MAKGSLGGVSIGVRVDLEVDREDRSGVTGVPVLVVCRCIILEEAIVGRVGRLLTLLMCGVGGSRGAKRKGCVGRLGGVGSRRSSSYNGQLSKTAFLHYQSTDQEY